MSLHSDEHRVCSLLLSSDIFTILKNKWKLLTNFLFMTHSSTVKIKQ